MAWLAGWTYRKSHVISQQAGAGTDYQKRIRVDFGAGADDGEDVFVDGKCQADFDDIRFTDNDETTLLDYWLESKTNSDEAYFWVKLDDDVGAGDVTIYVYYKNDAAATASDFDATFPVLSDDFEDGTVGVQPANWNEVTAGAGDSFEVANDEVYEGTKSVKQAEAVDAAEGNYSHAITLTGFSLRTKVRFDDLQRCYLSFKLQNTNYVAILGYIGDLAKFYWHNGAGWQSNIPNWGATAKDTWFDVEIQFDTANTKAKFIEHVNSWDSGWLALNANNDGGTFNSLGDSARAMEWWYDLIYVRKFVNPEPSHGAWGTEEGGTSIPVMMHHYNRINKIIRG